MSVVDVNAPPCLRLSAEREAWVEAYHRNPDAQAYLEEQKAWVADYTRQRMAAAEGLPAWDRWRIPDRSGQMPPFLADMARLPDAAGLRRHIAAAQAVHTPHGDRLDHLGEVVRAIYAYGAARVDVHERMHRRAALGDPAVVAEAECYGARPFWTLLPRTAELSPADGRPVRMPTDGLGAVCKHMCVWRQAPAVATETARIVVALARALGVPVYSPAALGALALRAFVPLFVAEVAAQPDVVCTEYAAPLYGGTELLRFCEQTTALLDVVRTFDPDLRHSHGRTLVDALLRTRGRAALAGALELGYRRTMGNENIGVGYEGATEAWAPIARPYWELYALLR